MEALAEAARFGQVISRMGIGWRIVLLIACVTSFIALLGYIKKRRAKVKEGSFQLLVVALTGAVAAVWIVVHFYQINPAL